MEVTPKVLEAASGCLDAVDGFAGPGSQVSLPEGLRAGGVGMTDTGNVLTAGSVLQGEHSLQPFKISFTVFLLFREMFYMVNNLIECSVQWQSATKIIKISFQLFNVFT